MKPNDFPNSSSSVPLAERPPTRWDGSPAAATAEEDPKERGGWFLLLVALILLPSVVVAAVVLSQDSSTDRLELTATTAPARANGTSDVPLEETSASEEAATPVTASVGETATPGVDGASSGNLAGEASAEEQTVVVIEVVDTGSNATPAAAPVVAAATGGTAISGSTPAVSVAGVTATVSPTVPTSVPLGINPTSSTTSDAPAAPDSLPQTSTTQAPSPFPSPTTTIRTVTTRAPTTTTTTTTTLASPTTTAAPTPTTEPAAFANRIDIGALGDTFVRFRFTAENTTGFSAIVRTNTVVVSRVSGTAIGGERHDVSVDGLMPGTDYTIQVTLNGPPVANSPAVSFRTSGGAAPPPATEQVSFADVVVVERDRTRFQINYASTVCANGSFVIRDSSGTIVGRNSGQASGCLRRHLAVPGFWTPALKPGETYSITLTLEANGQGEGNGNTRSTTVTVTTLE